MKDYLGNGNVVAVGMTRFGKSYAIKKILRGSKKGVLYFNTKRETGNLEGYIKASSSDSMKVIVSALRAGKKINYVPSHDGDMRSFELTLIIKAFLICFTETNYIYLAIDEVHMLRGAKVQNMITDLGTTGVGCGVRVCAISQRLAFINRALVTQSEKKILFHTEYDDRYYKAYGMPYEKINEMIKGQKYKFVIYSCGELEGTFTI